MFFSISCACCIGLKMVGNRMMYAVERVQLAHMLQLHRREV